jgi:hypothetical protein
MTEKKVLVPEYWVEQLKYLGGNMDKKSDQ